MEHVQLKAPTPPIPVLHNVASRPVDLEDEIFVINKPVIDPRSCRTVLELNGQPHRILVDTGASENVIALPTLSSFRSRPQIQATSLEIYSYGSDKPLDLAGEVVLHVKAGDADTNAKFAVVKANRAATLIGRHTGQQLGLIRLTSDISSVHDVVDVKDPSIADVIAKYSECFHGLGKIHGVKAHIYLKPGARPVAHPPSKVPAHLLEAAEKELRLQLDLNIIQRATGPTPWVSRMVVVPKQTCGQVRLTQDFRDLNRQALRESHPIPMFEELTDNIADSSVFSELDLNKAFHQIELDEESRQLTVFSTPLGLMRCIRMPMGFTSSSEILQRTLDSLLAGLPGVKHVHDNIFIHGSTSQEHLERLDMCLAHLKEHGITLNRGKCKFAMPKLEFMSTLYTRHGIQASSKHIEAIKVFPVPTDVKSVRSFLGLANFMRKFIPNMATVSAPLNDLTRKTTPWKWAESEQDAFDRIKQILCAETTLAYFDRKCPIHLWVDASPVGLGAILCQTDTSGSMKPVFFASRSLSDTEQRYAQTEREALAIKYGCLHFRHYLLGCPDFVIHTDHRPLLQLMVPGSRPTPRIERMVLAIQDYNYNLVHLPGEKNPADILSRHPLPKPTTTPVGELEDFAYCYSILQAAKPNALSLDDIRQATSSDSTLQAVISSLNTGQWHQSDPCMRSYFTLRHQLTAVDGIVMRSDRIVVPASLRSRVLQLTHRGHQGIVQTTDRLNSKVWWPKMSEDAILHVQACMACQATNTPSTTTTTPCKPLLSSRPWALVCAELVGPLPNGDSLLVLIDHFSRYPEVFIVKSMTSIALIPYFRQTFSRFGIPAQLMTDNGPQFVSTEFSKFLRSYGIYHRTSVPLWPQCNGEVERLNRVVSKVVRTATLEGTDRVEALDDWLLAYRMTAHPATGKSPASLIMQHCGDDLIPSVSKVPALKAITLKSNKFRQRNCSDANIRRRAQQHTLEPGDSGKMNANTAKPILHGILFLGQSHQLAIVLSICNVARRAPSDTLVLLKSFVFKPLNPQPFLLNQLMLMPSPFQPQFQHTIIHVLLRPLHTIIWVTLPLLHLY